MLDCVCRRGLYFPFQYGNFCEDFSQVMFFTYYINISVLSLFLHCLILIIMYKLLYLVFMRTIKLTDLFIQLFEVSNITEIEWRHLQPRENSVLTSKLINIFHGCFQRLMVDGVATNEKKSLKIIIIKHKNNHVLLLT